MISSSSPTHGSLIWHRLRNGCSSEHGNIPPDKANTVPLSIIRNRMAVCLLIYIPISNHLSDHISSNSLTHSIRSRTIRNSTSARVSVPSLLREEENSPQPTRPWVWRTNLAATKPFWENWFIGLSKKFLEAKGGKLLLLAGTDRLDKELIIGQMQGN